MTDEDLRNLERQLEEATGRDRPTGPPLDPETASLREAWRAFGQLLEAAHPLASNLFVPRIPASPRRRVGLRVVGVVAVAASLMVGAGVLWWTRTHPPQLDVAAKSAVPGTYQDLSPRVEHPTPAPAPSTEWTWDDAIDERIALASQAVLTVQGDELLLADTSSSLHYGLEQVESDLLGSPF